jgi:hypothetical protein
VVVLDPHGDLVKSILQRCPDEHKDRVVYFAPAEQLTSVLGLNPFEVRSESERDLLVGAVMDVFAHTWYGDFTKTPTLQNTLETLVRTLLAAYPTYQTSFTHMLVSLRFDTVGELWRKRLAKFAEDNFATEQKWRDWRDTKRFMMDTESSRNKINHILSGEILQNILCQPTSAKCFRFEEVLSNHGILLVNLARLNDENQKLLGSLILTQLVVMGYLRVQLDKPARVPCHIYADEFYKFNPQSFVTIINEHRAYRLFCTIAHQNLAQLDYEARAAAASCANTIVFRIQPGDDRVLQEQFILPDTFVGLSNLQRFEALVRVERRRKRHQSWVKTVREQGEENEAVGAYIRRRSETYGRPLEEISAYNRAILEVTHARERSKPPPRWDVDDDEQASPEDKTRT